MILRQLAPTDVEPLYVWRCDPETVQSSLYRVAPTWAEHERWVATQDPRDILIAVLDGEPIGCVRFTVVSGMTWVHVVVAPAWRHRGLGTIMLQRAIELRGHTVFANIRIENAASRRAFAKAGFTEQYVVAEWQKSR